MLDFAIMTAYTALFFFALIGASYFLLFEMPLGKLLNNYLNKKFNNFDINNTIPTNIPLHGATPKKNRWEI